MKAFLELGTLPRSRFSAQLLNRRDPQACLTEQIAGFPVLQHRSKPDIYIYIYIYIYGHPPPPPGPTFLLFA